MALTDNLLAYFSFDASDGDDSTANNNDLSPNNVTWVTGKLGAAAASMNGSSTTLQNNSYAYGRNSNDQSVSMWIKMSSGQGGDIYTSSQGTNNEDCPTLTIDPTSGKISAGTTTLRYSVNNNLSAETPAGGYNDNSWHHVVMTITGGTVMDIWVDNDKKVTGNSSTGNDAVPSGTDRLWFGHRAWDGSGGYTSGIVDEVGFWDRVLSDVEIGQLYNGGSGLAYPLTVVSDLSVDVNDTLSVAEGLTLLETSFVDTSDTLAIQEAIGYYDEYIVISETVTPQIISDVSVSDSLSISENLSRQLLSFIDVSESISVAEDVQLLVISPGYSISVFDEVSVTENVTNTGSISQSVFDTCSITESVSDAVLSAVSVFDTVAITESVNNTGNTTVSVFDAVTINEAPTVLLIGAGLVIFVSDDLDLAESTQFFFNLWNLSVFDSIALTESVQDSVSSTVSVFDACTLAENINTNVVSFASVFDTCSLTESLQLERFSTVSVSDTLTLTENLSAFISLNVSVSDALTCTESITRSGTLGSVSVSDALSLTEDVSTNLLSLVSVFDACSVSENVAREGFLNISKVDTLTITESVTTFAAYLISIAESLTLTESVTSSGTLGGVSVFDTCSLSDGVGAEHFLTRAVFDTVSISESPVQTDSVRFSPIQGAMHIGGNVSAGPGMSRSMSGGAMKVFGGVN